jgi:putative transposase
MDEMVVTIEGKRHYLWRAIDQEGEVLDILVQKSRDTKAAKRFFRKLLKGLRYTPRQLVTDKLGSYGAARRTIKWKSRISQPANRNARCGGSNPQVTSNGFSRCTVLLTISFALGGI